jgi:general secretion pathway protein M
MRLAAGLAVQHFWDHRSQRERVLLGLTAAGLVLAAMLLVAILPAWRTLQVAPQAQTRLNAQWQHMQMLQMESAALLKQAKREFKEAALRDSLAPLGASAQLHMGQTSAELSLHNAAPDALALWLLDSRRESGAVVREAHLQRSPALLQSGNSGPDGPSHWSGRLLLDLPR